jgi:hypothetical protein
LYVGRNSDSGFPQVLFALWVLSPFLVLVSVTEAWRYLSFLTQQVLYRVMLIFSLGSVGIYGYVALNPPGAGPAFTFLVVPLGSWLVLAMVVVIGERVSRGIWRRGNGT